MTYELRRLWIGTLDDRCCLECLRLDGQVFDPGNVPPAPHANCRCATVPILDNDYTGGRASVFGRVSPQEAALTKAVLIRLAEHRHAAMRSIEDLTLSSKDCEAIARRLLIFALEQTRAQPSMAAVDTILQGSATSLETVRIVVECCETAKNLEATRSWLARCCQPPCSASDAVRYLLTAAQCVTRTENNAFAMHCCDEAVAFADNSPPDLISVAKTLETLGVKERALAIAKTALEIAPSSKSAKSLVARLSGS